MAAEKSRLKLCRNESINQSINQNQESGQKKKNCFRIKSGMELEVKNAPETTKTRKVAKSGSANMQGENNEIDIDYLTEIETDAPSVPRAK